jgi:single-strand DNA-binding protein
MASLNRIVLVGPLTSDPDAKFTVEGVPVTRFRLAVNRFTKEGEPQAVDLIDVVAWGKAAEYSGQHLKKNKLALVEGRIQVRSFEAQGGQRKWVTEVVARSVQVLEPGHAAAQTVPQAAVQGHNEEAPSLTEEVADAEDDLPF